MLKRDGYTQGVPCWVDTNQPDPEAAVAFYGDLFGWECEDVLALGPAGRYYIGRLHGGDVAAVGSQAQDTQAPPVWNTYIWVQDADEAARHVQAAGGAVLAGPFDVTTAGRAALCSDLEGAAFLLWEARRHKGAQVVNEAGSVNFNGLNTHDLERAKAFYGSVFGWELLSLGGGAQAWRLPGYGDFLQRRDPGLRERMSASGAPEGFEDVVATVQPIADDSPATSPHWSVTFSVGDADAAAIRTVELGGRVIAAPCDAPWVRMAVIADPQGATFVVSQFRPENRGLASDVQALGATA